MPSAVEVVDVGDLLVEAQLDVVPADPLGVDLAVEPVPDAFSGRTVPGSGGRDRR